MTDVFMKMNYFVTETCTEGWWCYDRGRRACENEDGYLQATEIDPKISFPQSLQEEPKPWKSLISDF